MRLLASVFVLIFCSSVAHAEIRAINDPQDGWLNIRSGPGTSFSIIDRLYNGASVDVVGQEGNWINVQYGFGDSGWAYRPFTMSQSEFIDSVTNRYDPETLGRLGRFCWQPYLGTARDEEFGRSHCIGTYYCGDGGCDPIRIVVAVHEGAEEEFLALTQQFNLLGVQEYEGSHWRAGEVDYALDVMPGYEIETTLRLRHHPSIVRIAVREGGIAGSPPRMVNITEEQFFRFRGVGISELRAEVISAIEAATGRQCTTSDRLTCSVLPTAGRLTVDLLTPGTALTGRPDHWERSYWEIYVHWSGRANEYQLFFHLPITSVRRWPTTGDKPVNGFTSLDFDEGFEDLRTFIMERVAFSVGGDLSPSYH